MIIPSTPRRIVAAGASAILAAAITTAGCATTNASGITDADLNQRIQQASTPADHAAIAAYYDGQARESERLRRERQEARRHYAHTPASLFYPLGTTPAILEHYDRLIEGYDQTARESRALSQWHRQLAESARTRDSGQ